MMEVRGITSSCPVVCLLPNKFQLIWKCHIDFKAWCTLLRSAFVNGSLRPHISLGFVQAGNVKEVGSLKLSHNEVDEELL